ncbi:hypothetical protein ANCDUO_17420 [Ancylostoma duodenale]|uniref:MULE transposase domain-containing protein n=1 Tax=Ancylostoma duodenale TaxID=51022 RepID=A0A0C2G0Q7_9BILA|nr:hypothetical protein ANCDUO_17420 [Ancylostoma duodenale]
MADPCMLAHVCLPKEVCKDRASRFTYKNSVVECGLHIIVADGVHSFQSKKLGRSAQVYCVCRGRFDVPLLLAITPRKTEEICVKITTKLKECFDEIEDFIVADLTVVLDFEKAAKQAVSTVRGINPKGCSFHLTRCWIRKRDSLGLRQYIRGRKRIRAMARWWKIIKRLFFLNT